MSTWVPVKNFPDYFVNETGEVKSTKRNREHLLAPHKTQDGYIFYILSNDGVAKTLRANRLVAEAFIPNPENKETVNHIDGNKQNNSVSNLEWATLSEQMIHAYKTGLKKPIKPYLLTPEEEKEIQTTYKAHDKKFGMFALAKKFNVSPCTIQRCVKRK